MDHTTVVATGHDLTLSKVRALKSIREHVKSMESGGHFFCFGNRSTQAQSSDLVRWAVEVRDRIDKNIGNMFLNSIANSENAQPGAGEVCAISTIYFLDSFMKHGGCCVTKDDVKDGLRSVLRHSFRPKSHEILHLMSEKSSDRLSWDIFDKSVELAGSSGLIQVFSGKSDQTVIKKCSGYRFPIELPEVYRSASRISGQSTLHSPKIVVIDGIVERMSEISGLIHESYKETTPLVIVARGFSDDVSNTLGINYSTGNLNVIPCVVRYDMLGANMLKDMCVVIGCDIISSIKGEVVSAVTWNDVGSVDKVELSDNLSTLSLFEPSSKMRVSNHRKLVAKNRGKLEDLELGSHLDKRLATLGGNAVQVHLGKDLGDMLGITKDRIDHHVRYYRGACSKGIANLSEALEQNTLENVVLHKIISRLNRKGGLISVPSLVLGVNSGLSCATSIFSVSASITIDS